MTKLPDEMIKDIEERQSIYSKKMITEAERCCPHCHEFAKRCFEEENYYGARAYTAGATDQAKIMQEKIEELERENYDERRRTQERENDLLQCEFNYDNCVKALDYLKPERDHLKSLLAETLKNQSIDRHDIEYTIKQNTELKLELEKLKKELAEAKTQSFTDCVDAEYMKAENERLKKDLAYAKEQFDKVVAPFCVGGNFNAVPILKEENAELKAKCEKLQKELAELKNNTRTV